jgi:hypothetical protein
MIKPDFWKQVHSKWVSSTDGVSSHIKNDASAGSGESKEDIDAKIDELEKEDNIDISGF